MSEIKITNHAYDRAKERLSWKSKVLDKMAEIAFVDGLTHSETQGSLKKYITKLWFRYKHTNNVRIYGDNIYFFSNNVLITLYQLPQDLKKFVKYAKKMPNL